MSAVREWVNARFGTAVTGFLPSAVVKHTGVPATQVYEELRDICKEGKPKLLFDYRCEKCGSTLFTGGKEENPPATLYCDCCDEEWGSKHVPTMPVFKFNKEK